MRASGTLLLVMLAAAARGGDTPASADDSIANAKKDLETIKAPASQTGPGDALPSLDMKDIGPSPGGARSEAPVVIAPEKEASLDPTKKKEGTGNWLVDAMDKKSDRSQASRTRAKDDVRAGDTDLPQGDDKLGARGDREGSPMDDRDRVASREPADSVYNPLDSFMGGWISARDHDLLLPSSKNGDVPGGGLEPARADRLPGLDLGQQGLLLDNPAQGLDLAALGDSRGAANPYLEALDFSPSSQFRPVAGSDASGPGYPGFPEVSRGVSPVGVDPRSLDTSRNFIPDFAQPPDDDKYFKQMKRF
jgi:hypothetical protein